jgi:hypothetical protein
MRAWWVGDRCFDHDTLCCPWYSGMDTYSEGASDFAIAAYAPKDGGALTKVGDNQTLITALTCIDTLNPNERTSCSSAPCVPPACMSTLDACAWFYRACLS